MRITTVAFALGVALALGGPATFTAAQARHAKVMHAPRTRIVVSVAPAPAPYWDSNIVPRYRYRPEDDRVDPYGPSVVPVIRYGNQEVELPSWWYW
jgi:hypothetical protein